MYFDCDVLVAGSGAGGLAAAVTARKAGLDLLVAEKEPVFGGTTALSGGWLWIPNHPLQKEIGVTDSMEDAATYLLHEATARAGDRRLAVVRYNEHAKSGSDPDIHKGENAYNRFYENSDIKPNPCVAPLAKPPFYAVRLEIGDLGTYAGIATSGNAQVLDEHKRPIRASTRPATIRCPSWAATIRGPASHSGPP
jgi:succinate dehydrogenase/fumarate reductase flavoprotein subunit